MSRKCDLFTDFKMNVLKTFETDVFTIADNANLLKTATACKRA